MPSITEPAVEAQTISNLVAAHTLGSDLASHYRRVRSVTRALCEPLEIEDFVVQTMPDVSPTKWHLAHTTWFFETFVLKDHKPFDDAYAVLFNSYYHTVGAQHPRPKRGDLTRPTVAQIMSYREAVDEQVSAVIDAEPTAEVQRIIEVGLEHEQQHQELLLTDIKHVLSCNPIHPVYQETNAPADGPAKLTPSACSGDTRFGSFEGGLVSVGHGSDGLCFDNEKPAHQIFLQPYELADRLVTNADYLAFMDDGGYERHELWLSDGWDWKIRGGVDCPLYWKRRDSTYWQFTLHGLVPVAINEPVVHVSYFEASAFARWAGARLPREGELEVTSIAQPIEGNFLESGKLHPSACNTSHPHRYGDVWQWTESAYAPYPGYRAPYGAMGEYNGKFMCNQYVLRGGSCATPRQQVRASYRNFFPASACWQFSGIRLAKDR